MRSSINFTVKYPVYHRYRKMVTAELAFIWIVLTTVSNRVFKPAAVLRFQQQANSIGYSEATAPR